jgi:hypothetical protein
MPDRIPLTDIASLDPERLVSDDAFPGTYGFAVRLASEPDPEWVQEFDAVYDAAAYPGKPPVVVKNGALWVYYLPRYAGDLPDYLRFLRGAVVRTNQEVEKRNAVLPDEEAEKQAFRERLRALAAKFP